MSRPEHLDPLTIELLAWIARGPRTYEDAMECWRSSCPRQTVWEDASDDGFIHVERGRNRAESTVVLTPLGRTLLTRAQALTEGES